MCFWKEIYGAQNFYFFCGLNGEIYTMHESWCALPLQQSDNKIGTVVLLTIKYSSSIDWADHIPVDPV